MKVATSSDVHGGIGASLKFVKREQKSGCQMKQTELNATFALSFTLKFILFFAASVFAMLGSEGNEEASLARA
ncbi:MAG: hypothetical protein KDB90_14800 [Planctomycetes bacterium]|nr:hypothetical protein [Planctomycetota bacterium]